jgi:Domain of unknown function DUF83.
MAADVLKQSYAAEIARRLEEHPVSGLYLSDAGACPRMRVLKALNVPHRPKTAREVEIGLLGDVVHEYLWHNRILRTWPDAEREVWLDTPYGRARMDAIVASENLIIEVKKVKSAATEYLPKREHVVQLQAYMHFSPYKHGALLYAVLGLGWSELVFDVEYDPSTGAAIEAELEYLRELVQKQKPPPVPSGYVPTRWPCSWYDKELGVQHWCAYGQHCWREWGDQT